MNCSKCGKKMKAQGGQYTCVNESCPNYLIQVDKPKSPVGKVLSTMEKR